MSGRGGVRPTGDGERESGRPPRRRLGPGAGAVRATVREFAEREIAPVIGDYVERDAFPEPVVRGLADLGVLGLPFRTEDGGSGAGMLAFAVALEEIARIDVSVAAIVFAHSSPATILAGIVFL